MSYTPRGPTASKATPSTVCQKCLQRGHYSYECKSALQSRPYNARPSRSQQLLNPRLRAQLTNAAPEAPPAPISKTGLADAILAQKASERKAKKRREESEDRNGDRKRARSASYSESASSSGTSVSTISTGRSRSGSRSRSRSVSRDRSARERAGRGARQPRSRSRSRSRDRDLKKARRSKSASGRRNEYRDRNQRDQPRDVRGGQGRRSERSLSPYSKRIALSRGAG